MPQSKLTDKTKYEIAAHSWTVGGDRGKRIATRLATEHQLDHRTQEHITEFSDHHEVQEALLDHQKSLSPIALYNIAHNPNLHHKIINRSDLDHDHLYALAKYGTRKTHMELLNHPHLDTAQDAMVAMAKKGDHEIQKHLVKHAEGNFYLRHDLAVLGNNEIHNHLMDAGVDHKHALHAIVNSNKSLPATKKRARALYQQVHGEPMK